MAPRKEKTEKVSTSEAADTILQYLGKQNRPYSATDISANLHNKVTKAAAQKILKDLYEGRQIEGRAAGKQWVYHAIQEINDSMTPEQLSALDTTVNDLRISTTTLQTTAKTLRGTLSSLNSTLSTVDLIVSMTTLENEKIEIKDRLTNLEAGKAKKITQKERERVDSEWKMWSTKAKLRAKIVTEMWRLIEDVVQEKDKREEIRESLGLDD